MSIYTDDEYFALKNFVANYYIITGNSSMDSKNGKTFMDIFNDLERISIKKAKNDLMDFVLAVIESSYAYHPNQIKIIDAELTRRGIISLSSVRMKYTKKYEKIMKRGKINNMDEYSLIKGAISGDIIEDDDEVLKADRMIEEYENKSVK